MAGLGLGPLGLGLARSTGGVPLPAPTTVNYTYAQTVSGWGGPLSTTKNAARLYGAASGGGTTWAGYITGTDAYIFATSDFGANAGLISVSIDGGATFADAPRVSTRYTLFTGLPHARRFVVIHYGGSFGTAPYILNTGTIFEVTGQPPAMEPVLSWRLPEDGNTDTVSSNITTAGPANYLPALIPAGYSSTLGSNCPSIRFETNANGFFVDATSATFFVSIDGAAPTKYTKATTAGVLITGLSGTHIYNVWASNDARLYIGIIDGAFSNLASKVRIDQFGDSITEGSTSPSVRGDVETFSVAAALGYVGGTSGVGGNTIALLDGRLNTVLAGKVVTSSDVAIIAVGRNDTSTPSGTRQSGYVSIINKLIAKGYGTIICRSVLREVGGPATAINADIAAAVTTVGDPKAVFFDADGWYPISRPDDVHPDPTGYAEMRGFAVTDYPTLL